jgi:ATP synthase protein I
MQSPDPASRTLAVRILLWQAVVTAVIALVCFAGWGAQTGISALAGGGIGVLANLFMTLTALRPSGSAAGALGRVLLGQLMKVLVTVVLFVLMAQTGQVVWPAMLVAFVAPLVVFWFVPVLAARARRVRVES